LYAFIISCIENFVEIFLRLSKDCNFLTILLFNAWRCWPHSLTACVAGNLSHLENSSHVHIVIM